MHTKEHSYGYSHSEKSAEFSSADRSYQTLATNGQERENRSLNNFVECALLDLAYAEPNAETKAAINEAKTGKLHGPLDVSSVEAMYKSLGL